MLSEFCGPRCIHCCPVHRNGDFNFFAKHQADFNGFIQLCDLPCQLSHCFAKYFVRYHFHIFSTSVVVHAVQQMFDCDYIIIQHLLDDKTANLTSVGFQRITQDFRKKAGKKDDDYCPTHCRFDGTLRFIGRFYVAPMREK
uniref:Uncharacterized protein n=1 Tax=Myoviridae sp. ctYGJ17 TaxID=2827692 RepID=A0A8S5THX3_9CAUD|nr:MAG TPA: hypothetical protein [Myoviridae sp. ctYGJ17]DAI96820.1 MAG TPA: hypothetical protein [Caudoviricetes sp.]